MSTVTQNSNATPNSGTSQNELRRMFIAMLFALVAATIAQQIAELLSVITGGWDLASSPTKMLGNLLFGNGLLFSSLSHSFLALLLVSMSWVMWSKSQAAGHKTEIKSIFSKEFVLLLIEVFLVVLYFAIAKTMEQDFSAYSKNKEITTYVGVTSARPEALQMMWVFSVFFIWDLIVDVIYSPLSPHPIRKRDRVSSFVQGILCYCSISFVCAFAAWLISRAAPSAGNAYEALWGDIALVALLLFFALGKQLEFYLIGWFPGEETRDNTKRDHPPSARASVGIMFLILVYIYSYMVLIWPPSFLR